LFPSYGAVGSQSIDTPHSHPILNSFYERSFLNLLGTIPLFVPAIVGVAVGRILSIELDGNDAVWLELLVVAFKSEENCIGYVQNPGTVVP
jgi:hypothetical protein